MLRLLMKKLLFKEHDGLFALVLSFIFHAFIILSIILNAGNISSIFAYDKKPDDKKEIEDNYVFLVETPDKEEEENKEDTPFASDKSLRSKGSENIRPSTFFSDSSIFSFFSIPENSAAAAVERAPFEANENGELKDNRVINNNTVETYKPKNPSSKTDAKIPATFDDGADRAVVLSSETGSIQLGTKAQEYFWYFYTLVDSIRSSWFLTIPNQAHYLGLIKSDEVEVLLSIDEDGNILFEKFIKRSDIGQSSLDISCSKAIEYAKRLKPPPQGLVRDYAEDGKIYIPFRFIYQNFGR